MPSQQPPDPLTDGTFPDFPPRCDLQNTLYLVDPEHQGILRRHFGNQGSKLDPYIEYIDGRLAEGLENRVVLLRELRALGYQGSYTILVE